MHSVTGRPRFVLEMNSTLKILSRSNIICWKFLTWVDSTGYTKLGKRRKLQKRKGENTENLVRMTENKELVPLTKAREKEYSWWFPCQKDSVLLETSAAEFSSLSQNFIQRFYYYFYKNKTKNEEFFPNVGQTRTSIDRDRCISQPFVT